jgi:hypothetical protein
MYRQEYELEFLDDAEICNPSRELNLVITEPPEGRGNATFVSLGRLGPRKK